MTSPILVVDPDNRRLGRLAAELRKRLERPVVAAVNRESALAFCSACRPCVVVMGGNWVTDDSALFEGEMEKIFGFDGRPIVAAFSC